MFFKRFIHQKYALKIEHTAQLKFTCQYIDEKQQQRIWIGAERAKRLLLIFVN